MKERSARNKTIQLGVKEGQKYLQRCLLLKDAVLLQEVCDHTLYGDMLTISQYLPKECVDLLIVDPPYNLTKSFHGQQVLKTGYEDYAKYTRQWLQKIVPLLKPSASLYVCCDWESGMVIGPVLAEYFKVRSRITWQREKGRGAKANWKNGLEDIWFATCSEEYVFNLDAVKTRRRVLAPYRENGRPKDWQESDEGRFRDTCPSNFWGDITIPFWSMAENTAHPTQKPEKLIAKLILASSRPGDLVLDPFLGSGTTSVVAKKLGRHYMGIEQNPQYCIWAEKRLEAAQTDTRIQGYEDGIFWERNYLPKRKETP